MAVFTSVRSASATGAVARMVSACEEPAASAPIGHVTVPAAQDNVKFSGWFVAPLVGLGLVGALGAAEQGVENIHIDPALA
ncbi:MAG TPA: hypothetical protein PKD63_09295 [Solirubrobacteraceae bacterium]|nr:hypothetical protein [Solirubrobacteraceae bacterium]